MLSTSAARCANKNCQSSVDSSLRRCGRCRAIAYCSKECQLIHWPVHREVCTEGLRADLTTKSLAFIHTITERAEQGCLDVDDEVLQALFDLDIDSVKGKKLEKARTAYTAAVSQVMSRMPRRKQCIAAAFTQHLSSIPRAEAMAFMQKFLASNMREQLNMAREIGLLIEIAKDEQPLGVS